MNLAEHVEIAVAGHAAGVLNSMETGKLALLCGDAGQIIGAFEEKQSDKKHNRDNQRQNDMLLQKKNSSDV